MRNGWAGAVIVALAHVAPTLCVPTPTLAQDARVRTDVDTTLVTVGDRIHLSVSVEHAVGARVVWPDSLDLSPFEVLEAEALPPSNEGDRVHTGAVFTLTVFELGEHEIPSFPVQISGPGEQSETLSTDRFGVEVVSVGTDEGGDIRDIRGPLALPLDVVSVSVLLLVLLAVLGLAIWLIRRWTKSSDGTLEASPPSRPAHEVALKALARVEASQMLERGQVKEYHIEVSEILRRYVEQRFRVPALEMTTREVMEGLGAAQVDLSFQDGLRRFLDQCDLVKFAKVRPIQAASRAVLELGRDLIEGSIPEPAPDTSDVESEALV